MTSFFADNPAVLSKTYNFITLTEVAEHLSEPGIVIDKLITILKNGGYLAIMTKDLVQKEDFKQWFYKKEPTHIAFYNTQTYNWIAKNWNLKIVFREEDLVIFQKQTLNR